MTSGCPHSDSELGGRGTNENKLSSVGRPENPRSNFLPWQLRPSNEHGMEPDNADAPRATPAAVCAHRLTVLFINYWWSDGSSEPPNSLTPHTTCCKSAETLLSGSVRHPAIWSRFRKSFNVTLRRVGKLSGAFVSGAPTSSCSYFKPTKCKSDCRQLVLLALAVRRVDKWLQAGGRLINCSSLHSSAPSMSTHAPRTDIHLAISNLKSGQCVFIRVRWGEGSVGTLEDRAGTLWIFTTNPRWTILCIEHSAKKTLARRLAPVSRNMAPLCAPCGGLTLLHHTQSK